MCRLHLELSCQRTRARVYLLKYVDGKVSTLVFIDPNGYGVPAVRHDIVSKISKTKNTDVLVTFSWRICREMGYTLLILIVIRQAVQAPQTLAESLAPVMNVPIG